MSCKPQTIQRYVNHYTQNLSAQFTLDGTSWRLIVLNIYNVSWWTSLT